VHSSHFLSSACAATPGVALALLAMMTEVNSELAPTEYVDHPCLVTGCSIVAAAGGETLAMWSVLIQQSHGCTRFTSLAILPEHACCLVAFPSRSPPSDKQFLKAQMTTDRWQMACHPAHGVELFSVGGFLQFGHSPTLLLGLLGSDRSAHVKHIGASYHTRTRRVFKQSTMRVIQQAPSFPRLLCEYMRTAFENVTKSQTLTSF
jgi:hypothetical protein